MKVNVKARNLEVTLALREYLEKRLAKFEKLVGAEEAQATFSVIKDRHRVEVTIPLNGRILRGEEEGYDMYSAIDSVSDKLESQVQRYKTRLSKKGRGITKDAHLAALVSQPHPEEEDEFPVRVKRFPLKPMPVEEAIMQMNLLGHNFFLFLNADGEQMNLVYKRRDGSYGLLAPEV